MFHILNWCKNIYYSLNSPFEYMIYCWNVWGLHRKHRKCTAKYSFIMIHTANKLLPWWTMTLTLPAQCCLVLHYLILLNCRFQLQKNLAETASLHGSYFYACILSYTHIALSMSWISVFKAYMSLNLLHVTVTLLNIPWTFLFIMFLVCWHLENSTLVQAGSFSAPCSHCHGRSLAGLSCS